MNFTERFIRIVILIVVFISGFSSTAAQSPGKIRGSVNDQFDAVIVGVEINLTDSTNSVRKTFTNQTGNFLFNDVNPGNYTLIVSAAGFLKTFKKASR